jgi:hypothetical protein
MTTCQKMPTMSSAPVTYRSDYFFSDSPQSTATVESQTLSGPESHARSLSNLPDLHELTNLPSLPNLPNISNLLDFFFQFNLPRLPGVVVTSSTWHVLLNQPTNHPTAQQLHLPQHAGLGTGDRRGRSVLAGPGPWSGLHRHRTAWDAQGDRLQGGLQDHEEEVHQQQAESVVQGAILLVFS